MLKKLLLFCVPLLFIGIVEASNTYELCYVPHGVGLKKLEWNVCYVQFCDDGYTPGKSECTETTGNLSFEVQDENVIYINNKTKDNRVMTINVTSAGNSTFDGFRICMAYYGGCNSNLFHDFKFTKFYAVIDGKRYEPTGTNQYGELYYASKYHDLGYLTYFKNLGIKLSDGQSIKVDIYMDLNSTAGIYSPVYGKGRYKYSMYLREIYSNDTVYGTYDYNRFVFIY